MPPTQDNRMPFLMGSSLRRINALRIVAPPGGGISQGSMPRNGLGARLRLCVVVQLPAGATVDSWTDPVEGIYSLIKNIQVTNNNGIILCNASAFSLAQRSELRRFVIGTQDLKGHKATGAGVLRFYVDIPFTPNLSTNMLFGLIGLQSNTAEWTVKIQWADLHQAAHFSAGNADGYSAYAQGWLDFFDIPDPSQFKPAPLNYAYMLTDQTIAGATFNQGVNDMELSPMGGTLSRLLMTLVDTNGQIVRQQIEGDTVAAGTPYLNESGVKLDNVDFLTQSAGWVNEWEYTESYAHPNSSGLRPSILFLDALDVLEHPNAFEAPLYKFLFIDPNKYASVKPYFNLSLNGGQVARGVVVKELLQPVTY